MKRLSRRSLLLSTFAAFAKTGGVQLGVCENPEAFSKAEQLGFDYFEPSALRIAAMSDAAFTAFRDQVLRSRIRCMSVNKLMLAKVVGPEVNLDAVSNYLDSTLDRCRALGCRIVVWGSAASRQVPEGYSRDAAWSQIKTFLTRAGDMAKSKDLLIAIEPLRKQESNIINTGAEALRLVEEIDHPQVKMIIDYYHMRIEKEDPEIVRTAKAEIVHMHFANPAGRRWPKQLDEDPEYARFFDILRQVRYEGGLSLEGNGKIEDDGAAGLDFFRHQL
ncbi:MAG: sugar phosphate isomerase/epimerase family protein [Bryobacteraceae bacterium]